MNFKSSYDIGYFINSRMKPQKDWLRGDKRFRAYIPCLPNKRVSKLSDGAQQWALTGKGGGAWTGNMVLKSQMERVRIQGQEKEDLGSVMPKLITSGY